jgi:hypothetical protein
MTVPCGTPDVTAEVVDFSPSSRTCCVGLNNGEQIDCIVLDFSKAFDKVPHQRLINKYNYYGIQGKRYWSVVGSFPSISFLK